jgi:hypothetical protein
METEQISIAQGKGISTAVMMMQIVYKIKGIDSATISNKYTNVPKRTVIHLGDPITILNQMSGDRTYIDSGNVYILKDTDVLTGDLIKVDDDNGLIGTPKYFNLKVDVEMIFEPRIKPSQLIELDAYFEDRFNGFYKVVGFNHKGVISGSVGGECKSAITMMRLTEYDFVVDRATNEYRGIPLGN